MPLTVDVDPTVPLGSESLKLGPTRIKAIAAALLRTLGFDGDVLQEYIAPFAVDPASGLATVVGDPVLPLGIATLESAGRKATFAGVTSADGISYSGTPSSPIGPDGYDTSNLYIISNDGMVSGANAVTLQLGTGPAAPVNRSDGSSLQFAGEFGIGFYLLMFDSANFRIVNFIGGPVPNAIQLPGDPTTALQATPKRYVDTVVGHQTVQPTIGVIIVGNTATTIATLTFTTPNDGNNYLVFAQYSTWVSQTSGGGTDIRTMIWVDANGEKFAMNSVFTNNNNDAQGIGAAGNSGYCVTVFPANTSVTVKLVGQNIAASGDSKVNTTQPQAPDAPATQLGVTLVRVEA